MLACSNQIITKQHLNILPGERCGKAGMQGWFHVVSLHYSRPHGASRSLNTTKRRAYILELSAHRNTPLIKYATHNMRQKSWKKLGYVPDSEDEFESSDGTGNVAAAPVNHGKASQRQLLTSHSQFVQRDHSTLIQIGPIVRSYLF